jgi:hypothetical protein
MNIHSKTFFFYKIWQPMILALELQMRYTYYELINNNNNIE